MDNGGMVNTSPDWLSPGIDGGKREDPRPYPSVQSPTRPPRRGPGEACPEGPGSGARAHTQRRCPLTPRTAHHTPLVAVLQSAARARCTGPTRCERRGSTRGSAPTTSNAPPWHRGAD